MRRIAFIVTAIVATCIAGIALAQFSIDAQMRGILDRLVAKPPAPFTSFKYRDVSYDLAARKLTVSGLELRGGTDDKPHEVSIERIELVDFNPAMIEKISNPDLYKDGKGDGGFASIASDGLVLGMRSKNGDELFNLTETRLSKLTGRQFDVAPTAANFPKDSPRRNAAMIMAAFTADSIVLSGMEAGSNGKGVRVTKMTLTRYEAGKFAEYAVQGMRILDKNVESVTIDGITLRGFDLRPAMPDMLANKEPSFGDPARKPIFDEFRVQGVGGPILEQQGFRMGELVGASSRSGDLKTEKYTFKINGIELRPGTAPDNKMAEVLQMLRYPSLPMELNCEGGHDYSEKISWVDKCDLVSAGAATLSLKYRLGGVQPEAFAKGPDGEGFAQGIAQMQLIGLQITLRDQSLVDRALTAAGTMEGKSLAAKREELVQQIKMGSAGFTQGSPRLQQAVAAIVAFINKPDVLTIELAPKAPVRFSEFNAGMMADPTASADKLGLAVRTAP